MSITKLSPKQEMFCQKYIELFNATQAYIKAGYKVKNENVAGREGFRLLKNPKIEMRIQELMKDTVQTNKIEASKVLERIAAIAFSKITDFLSVDKLGEGEKYVNIKPSEEWPADKIGVVSEVKQTKHGISLKLHSSPDMLKVLCQYLGLLKEQLNVKSEVHVNQLDFSKLSEKELVELVNIIAKIEGQTTKQ